MATVNASNVVPTETSSAGSFSDYLTTGRIWTCPATGGAWGRFAWAANTATLGIPIGSVITNISCSPGASVWQNASAAVAGNVYADCQLGVLQTTTSVPDDPSSISIPTSKAGGLLLSGHISLSLLFIEFTNVETFYTVGYYVNPKSQNFTITYTPPEARASMAMRGCF